MHYYYTTTFVIKCRLNIINNIYKQYKVTGFIWEQYNDRNGKGKVREGGNRGDIQVYYRVLIHSLVGLHWLY